MPSALKKNNFRKKYKDYASTLKNGKETNEVSEENSNSIEPVKETAHKNDN